MLSTIPQRGFSQSEFEQRAQKAQRIMNEEKLGWEPSVPFESGIKKTIQWYCDHQQWIERINNGQYRMSE